jgi:BlaI family penicillinase repressor
MAWTPRDITETELAVLRMLWKRGPSTIRELTDRLYPDGGHSHYATVQSLLDRLQSKGFVDREKQGRINVFEAAISRGEVIARRLRATADSLCEGSMAPLLTHLVGDVDLSKDELDTLERLIDRLDDDDRRESGGE